MAIKVLAIESSCDESAVSIVTSDREIIFDRVFSQDHSVYNGVFPEVASREHLKILPKFIEEATPYLSDVDYLAVTVGPGLIGSLIVGVMLARGLSYSTGKNLIPINHLEGHALSSRLTNDKLNFPFLLLLVSGGHSKIVLVLDIGDYKELGDTRDDSFGEAFDKVAKMLGLGYPGGPKIEECAKSGDINAFDFPRPLVRDESCDFSLSGLKTSVRYLLKDIDEDINKKIISDICASFQESVKSVLIIKLKRALQVCNELGIAVKNVVAAGGVASNKYICEALKVAMVEEGREFYAPPKNLCCDNAAMIAWAAIERLERYSESVACDGDLNPRANYPLCDTFCAQQ